MSCARILKRMSLVLSQEEKKMRIAGSGSLIGLGSDWAPQRRGYRHREWDTSICSAQFDSLAKEWK